MNKIHADVLEECTSEKSNSELLLKTKVIFRLQYEGNKISKSKKRRVYLEKLYSIPLGDREKHKIAIDSDILVIDGKRVDISSL